MLIAATLLAPWLGAVLLAPQPLAAPAALATIAPIVVAADATQDKTKDKSDKADKNADKQKDKSDKEQSRERYHDRGRGPEQTERLARGFSVGANGSLFLTNIAGDITIKGGSGNEVRVEALKHGKGNSDDEARAQLQNIQVTMNEVGGRVEVKALHAGRNNRGWVDFTITVPSAIRVEVQSVSGDLNLTGVRGEVHGQTVSGDVTGTNLGHVAELKTMSGNLRLTGIESAGPLTLSAMSGDVTIDSLKAPSVDANSVSGDVTLRNCGCDRVHMTSVSGDLEYVGQISRSGRYEIKTHSGDVRLAVPMNSGFEIDANSFSGDITFDPPIANLMSQSRRGPGRMAHGVVGNGGAYVELSSFSGDVVVNRGGK